MNLETYIKNNFVPSENILGCFVSTTVDFESKEVEKEIQKEKGELFRSYIWGKKGIAEKLKPLKYLNYGIDLKLILFQFDVNPIEYLLENLKEIERYRKSEKAIGIPIIINDNNFFKRSEVERFLFFQEVILAKMDLLTKVIKRNKLDTNIELLKSDINKILTSIIKEIYTNT